MVRETILYSRFKVSEELKDKKMIISNDCKRVYYKYNDEDITIKDLDIIPQDEVYSFIKFKLKGKQIENYFDILLELDLDKQLISNRNLSRGRKYFFKIMEKCYLELKYNYIGHITLNMFEDTFNTREDTVSWMLLKEKKVTTYFSFPELIFRVSGILINLNSGSFLETTTKTEINIRGGILIDNSDYYWINNLVKLNRTNKNKIELLNIFDSNSTLVVCNKSMINSWVEYIHDKKVLVISDKKQHSKVCYKDIIDSDFVLVSIDYFSSKNYSNYWDDYVINETIGVEDIFKIMKDEYLKYENILDQKNPIFSLVKWKRLVIDSTSLETSLNNSKTYDLINTIKSKYKWIQLKKFPLMKEELLNLISFLTNIKNLNYPLYNSKGKLCYIKNIVKKVENNNLLENKGICVDKKYIKINIGKYEKTIYNSIYKGFKNRLNFSEIIDVFSSLLINHKSKRDIMKQFPTNNKNNYINLNNDCQICLDTIDNKSITKCGHCFCTLCIIESLIYSDSCPICRDKLNIKKISTLTKSTQVGLKYKKILDILNSNIKNTLIYFRTIELANYFSLLLNKKNIEHNLCIGTSNKMNTIIDDFNNNSKKTLLMCFKGSKLSKNVKDIDRIIFADYLNDSYNEIDYYGHSYINKNIENIEVYYLLYKNTCEERIYKCLKDTK